MLSLLFTLLTLPSPAHAGDTFNGLDAKNKACEVAIEDDRGQATLRLKVGTSVYLKPQTFTFVRIPLHATADGYEFDVVTYEAGENYYMPPIGAIITIGNLGVLKVSGKVTVSAGQAQSVQMYAIGGLGNWWRANLRCQRKGN